MTILQTLSVVYSKSNPAKLHFLRQSPKTCFQRRETQTLSDTSTSRQHGSCFSTKVRFVRNVLLSVGPKKLPREKCACLSTLEVLMPHLHLYDNTILPHCKLLVLTVVLVKVGVEPFVCWEAETKFPA